MLHLVASGGLYGIERMLLGLLPALRERGCAVELACLNAPDGPGAELGRAVESFGIPVHYAGLAGRIAPRGLLKLRRILLETRPRLLHVHGYKATIVAGAYALARRIPTVATFHTHALHDAHVSSSIVRLEGHILRRLQGIAAVSDPVQRELWRRGISAQSVHVIPNGIADPQTIRNGEIRPPEQHPVLLCVGRLIRKKNIHVLIDAVDRLRQRFPHIQLLIAGEGPFRDALEKQVTRLELSNSVQFLGFVQGIQRLLAGCDCFVLPSQTEGMPISVLEAMAAGTPIVATCVGAIPEIARDGQEAVLVPPDDLGALVEALSLLLRDEENCSRLGQRARARFLQEFTAERMAQRYLAFYRTVLGGAGREAGQVGAAGGTG